jgi:hypothetical protein
LLIASDAPTLRPYRFHELGSIQFDAFCRRLLELEAGFASGEWREAPSGSSVMAPEGVALPSSGNRLAGPALMVVAWFRDGTSPRAQVDILDVVTQAQEEWRPTEPRSLLVLTNAVADDRHWHDVEARYLGPEELTHAVAASPTLRLQSPALLGIAEPDELIPKEARERSTGDVRAAADLARVFVATGPYVRALEALERHHFAVLTGPPEVGKTAIARTIGLALLSDGWEFHECIRPEELWRLYSRDRKQVFVADDAFGSTEYRPEAADRWAVELDRALRTMDGSHLLVWTSRPAPLKAALRRLHREHGVERFPAPAQVQVDAADLDVAEKALILFRHAKRAALPRSAIALVQQQGMTIVGHEHFTPERIRRFVADRLRELDRDAWDAFALERMISDGLRRPTAAMAASFRALAPEHRAVLVALLDAPPGPVTERELVAAVRRHSQTSFARSPTELVDRLTDHFLRVVEPKSIAWVHPSWRDLVVEELVRDSKARRTFLLDSSIEGLLLALSTAGGEAGERVVPLLVEDADWDALADRIGSLGTELDGPAITRLLMALAEARATVDDQRDELDALAVYALACIARRWDETRAVIQVGLLSVWFELAADLPERPAPPDFATTWIELLPAEHPHLDDDVELARWDEWTALAELLMEHVPQALVTFAFPARQGDAIRAFVACANAEEDAIWHSARRELVGQILRRLARLAPALSVGAGRIWLKFSEPPPSPFDEPAFDPRPISRELRRILDAPTPRPHSDAALVRRVLRDL